MRIRRGRSGSFLASGDSSTKRISAITRKMVCLTLIAIILLGSTSTTETTHQGMDPTGRWVGGVITGDDYAAVVLRMWKDDDELRASLAYPNQRRAGLGFDRVSGDGARIRMHREHESEVWNGDISGNVFRGAFQSAGEHGTFELLHVAEVSTARLRSLEGVYGWPDGKRIRIAYLPRVTDELLSYFDETTGEDQWLFPTTDSTFIAGPTFEQPLPERRRVIFRRGSGGQTRLAWRRDGKPEVSADRIGLALDTTAVASEVRAFLAERDAPSVAVAVVTAQGVVWSGAFGLADRDASRAATLETPYQIGSVTKVFTAALLLRLRDRGLLQLDDPLGKWLPSDVQLPTGPAGITLRHLLTHSAGLPGDPVNRQDVDGVMQPYSVRELYAGLRETHLRAAPGREWYYSNLGYALLGHVIERVTGRPFEAVLKSDLLAPLDMLHSSITLEPEAEASLASHYWPEDTIRRRHSRWVFGEVAAFGGLATTATDLAKFVAFELGDPAAVDPPLSRETVAESQRPQYVFDGWRQAMGIGWWVRRDPEVGTIVHHGGEVDGHSSYVALSRTHGVGVIVLANLGGPTATDLGEQVLRRTIESARVSGLATRDQAFVLYLDADWADAAWALATVAGARPTDGVAWLRLGVARYRLNRFTVAAEAFERAAALDFFPQQAMYYLARIRSIRGDPDGAFDWLRRAIDAGLGDRGQIERTPELEPLHRDPRWAPLLDSASEKRP
jgi:CubicO group peptidase (beta-lactamase class C family)